MRDNWCVLQCEELSTSNMLIHNSHYHLHLIWESIQVVTLFSYFQMRLDHFKSLFLRKNGSAIYKKKTHPISHTPKIMVIKNDTWLKRKQKLPQLSRQTESPVSLWFAFFQMRRGRKAMKKQGFDKGCGHINDVLAMSPEAQNRSQLRPLCFSCLLVEEILRIARKITDGEGITIFQMIFLHFKS